MKSATIPNSPYLIYEDGTIINQTTNRVVRDKHSTTTMVTLIINWTFKNYNVSKLISETFKENPYVK